MRFGNLSGKRSLISTSRFNSLIALMIFSSLMASPSLFAATDTFTGVGNTVGGGTWTPSAPSFIDGSVNANRWNIGNTTANGEFTYDSSGSYTIDLNLSGETRGIVIGSGNNPGSTSTLNVTDGTLIVIEGEDSNNAGVSVGVPAGNGEHGGVLNLNGGDLTIQERDEVPEGAFTELNINFRGGANQLGEVIVQNGSTLTVDEIEHIHDNFTASSANAVGTFRLLDGTWVGARIRNNDTTPFSQVASPLNMIVDGGTWEITPLSTGGTGRNEMFISSTLSSLDMQGDFTINTNTYHAQVNPQGLTGSGNFLISGGGIIEMNSDSETYTGEVDVTGARLEGFTETNGNLDADATSTVSPGSVASVGRMGFDSADIDGTLEISFGRTATDILEVTNALDLTGATIDFAGLNEASFLTGESHVIASYGSLVGSESVTVTNLPIGFDIDFDYMSGNQIAIFLTDIPGDFNDDDVVDAADYTIWRDTVGSTTDFRADADLNGVIDDVDYGIWADNYGISIVGAASSASAVPEPSAAMICLVGLAAFLRKRN